MSDTEFAKCPTCGAPFRFYNMTTTKQDVCPECRAAREDAIERPTAEQQADRLRRRQRAFP